MSGYGRWAEPTSDDASAALAGLSQARRRSRRYIRDTGTVGPLIAWGTAWVVGALALTALSPPWGYSIGIAGCIVAACVSWPRRHVKVVRGSEQRFAWCWWVLMASSPVLVLVAGPPDRDALVLFLCCLWAVGMLLYGIGANDHPLAVVGGFILMLSAVTRLVIPASAMLTVGAAGGLTLAALGRWRQRTAR